MSELQELTVKELITKMYNTQHQLQRNTAYAVGDIATSPDLPSWAYLECVQAGTTSSTPPPNSFRPIHRRYCLMEVFSGVSETFAVDMRWAI